MLYMLDTNIISYISEGNQTVIDNLIKCMYDGHRIAVSTVAYYEVKRGLLYNSSIRKLMAFLNFISQVDIIPITDIISDCAAKIYADLRRNGQLIEDADIFIGAAAVVNHAVLVTNNETHLSRIDGLKIENWVSI